MNKSQKEKLIEEGVEILKGADLKHYFFTDGDLRNISKSITENILSQTESKGENG